MSIPYSNGYPSGVFKNGGPYINGGVYWGKGEPITPVVVPLQAPPSTELPPAFRGPCDGERVLLKRRWEYEEPSPRAEQWRTFELSYGGIPPHVPGE